MSDASGYKWQCFPSQGPPDALVAGWRMLIGLPRGAQHNLWYLLEHALREPESTDLRQQVEGYAARFEANPAQVLGALRICISVLRDGAARNLDRIALMSDLGALSGGNPAGVELLSKRYDKVRDELRIALLEDTLADHGNVLVGFDWRIDHVNASNHGEFEDVPIVYLNLSYRHGSETRKLPLQLSPSAIASLKNFFERFETNAS